MLVAFLSPRICVQGWYALYGVFIALMLLTVATAVLVCPGGLTLALFLMLLLLFLYMLVPLVLVAGQVALQDGCWQTESVALNWVRGLGEIPGCSNKMPCLSERHESPS